MALLTFYRNIEAICESVVREDLNIGAILISTKSDVTFNIIY